MLAPYVLRTLDLTAFQFGMIGAAGGVGAFLGATVTSWVGRRLGTGRTIIVCRLISAFGDGDADVEDVGAGVYLISCYLEDPFVVVGEKESFDFA